MAYLIKIVGTFEIVPKSFAPKAGNADEEKPKTKDIIVKFFDKKIMLLKICRSDRTEDVKIKIQERTGIPIEDQRITYNFEPLKD